MPRSIQSDTLHVKYMHSTYIHRHTSSKKYTKHSSPELNSPQAARHIQYMVILCKPWSHSSLHAVMQCTLSSLNWIPFLWPEAYSMHWVYTLRQSALNFHHSSSGSYYRCHHSSITRTRYKSLTSAYVYVCMCLCVCGCMSEWDPANELNHWPLNFY